MQTHVLRHSNKTQFVIPSEAEESIQIVSLGDTQF